MLFFASAVSAISVIIIISLIVIFLLYREVVSLKTVLIQMSSVLGNLTLKSQAQEIYLHKLGTSFSEFTTMVGNTIEKISFMIGTNNFKEFRTSDGRYAAASLEELLSKLKQDGVEEKYMSKEEMDNLRRMFEEEGDDDDDMFNPNKGKF